ncbi:BTB/POZ domain-containing protein At3g22104 isoform X3 [Prosopis cineraria]|uniref:BTB/POZ domain-containing protein At3g22104 isoform X3 n=1 Tax=Prosopis cineraria TaxID=364024 RepID=UPI00240FC35A|nr:BTB/POZ domain-containing protein At3g22104 isoform X3 [Prosopis cineraria]
MEVCSILEVDVNGQETFMVDKDVIAQYSGKFSKFFGKSTSGSTRKLKVIFHDFPGGAEGFELMLRFCYSNGTTDITPANSILAHCAAEFMEMKDSVPGGSNLLARTEKSLQETSYWTWSDLLIALKQCQSIGLVSDSSLMLEKCLDSLVGRLVLACEASPCPSTCSPDSFGFRFSCDSKSTESIKTNFSHSTWWFEDLVFLSPLNIEKLVQSMLVRKLDQAVISRFLLFYQKAKFSTATTDEKRKIIEMVIDMHCNMDQSIVSCKTLFGILRLTLGLNINKCRRNKLENMIGSQLDQATLDNLLVPSPYGISYLYDVNLVLRFLKAFLRQGGTCLVTPIRMKKVAALVDLYAAEIAPDPCLKPSKFMALATALPDYARDSYDELYHAMDMYLKALISQQSKLNNLLHGTPTTPCSTSFTDSPCSSSDAGKKGRKDKAGEQVVLYSGKFDVSADNEKLGARLQGMQWRVMELEKICRKMQTQMAKISKSRASGNSYARSLPKLCS